MPQCQANGCEKDATHTERVDTGKRAGRIPFCDEHGLANGG